MCSNVVIENLHPFTKDMKPHDGIYYPNTQEKKSAGILVHFEN